MPRKRTGKKENDAILPDSSVQRHSVTSHETARSLAIVLCVPGNCNVSYLSFVHGRNLLEELNGGENSLHWMANMFPLFSIMTLCI